MGCWYEGDFNWLIIPMVGSEPLFYLLACFFLLLFWPRRFRRHFLHYLHATAAAKFLFMTHHRLHHAGKINGLAAAVELFLFVSLLVSHFDSSFLPLVV